MSSDPPSSIEDAPLLPPVPPAVRKRLQKCYDHGTKLMEQEKYDFEYANTMFTECVGNDPGNLIYVESFLENLQRKYKNNKKGSRLGGLGRKANLRKFAGKKDWLGLIQTGLDQLKHNPWDVAALRAIAEACETLGLNEVELRFLKNALDAKPKDPDVNRHCAKSLARMGQFDMAIACWHRVEENKRGDKEASRMISVLNIERNRARAGFGDNLNFASSPRPQKTRGITVPEADSDNAQSQSKIQLTPRQSLEKAITDDPTIVENYLELAQLLCQEDRFAEANQLLQRGLAASGGDIKLRETFEEVEIMRSRSQLDVAEKLALSEQTEEAKSLAVNMKAEILQREIEIFETRQQRYPEETRYSYELGIRLKRIGKYEQAIETLLRATDDRDRKAAVQLELGECHQHRKDYQAAMQAYRLAMETESKSQNSVKKLAFYRAAVLATGLKDVENAKKYLKLLAQIDFGYKDVKARLDKLERFGDKI